jgi:arylsulfatase A
MLLQTCKLLVLSAALVLLNPAEDLFGQEDLPNIVLILCDDLGYGDLGIHGHPHIQTTNIDRLAREGIRFTSFYSAAPVCSPSRVGLLTGRSPNRAGIYDWIPEARKPQPDARDLVHLRKSETTLPQLLKATGYATCMAGKWHCNSRFNSADQPQPGDAGFDHWLATHNNAAPSHENPANYVRNGQPVGPLNGYSCQIAVDEAIHWLTLQRQQQPEQPFFLYLPFHEPHEPVASPPELVEQYRPVTFHPDQAQYFANVHNVDLATGRLLDALKQLAVRDNTLVIFSSDNGPETLNRYKTANRSWGQAGSSRGVKLHTHDGGFHVAGFMNWPAKIREGRVVTEPVSSLDLLPTICELADVAVPAERTIDGISIADMFANGQMPQRSRPLLWVYYNAINEGRVAMRHGPWKLLARINSGRFPRYENLTSARLKEAKSAELTDFEIYDLEKDPGETLNLAGHGLENESQLIDLICSEYHSLANDSLAWDHEPQP